MKFWLSTLALHSLHVPTPTSAQECVVECPRCQYKCQLTVERKLDTNHCWDVEEKAICVPKITFPWQSCCAPKCARVLKVRVLKKVEYECERCYFQWKASRTCCGSVNGKCGGESCANVESGLSLQQRRSRQPSSLPASVCPAELNFPVAAPMPPQPSLSGIIDKPVPRLFRTILPRGLGEKPQQ